MNTTVQKRSVAREIKKHRQLYTLMLPGLLLLFIFAYIPMVGIIIAFKDYTFVGGFSAVSGLDLSTSRKYSQILISSRF